MALRRLLILTALATLLFAALPGCKGEAPTFRVGYMICNSLEETRARFDPLTAYLSEKLGAKLEPVYLDTFDFEEAFEKGELDFTHTNSLLFVTLNHRHKVKLLAAEKRGSFGALTRGTVIVRADSGIETLADLKDKRLVFGPQWAPYGFLSPYALLLQSGVDPEADLGPYGFPGGSWKHEKIIYSVLYGAYDAGAAPLIDLEEMAAQGKIDPAQFRVIGSSELGPYCTFGASPKIDGQWAEKFQQALLSLNEDVTADFGGERLRVLDRALITGFEKLDISDYDIIHEWAKLAKMPPYEEF